MNENEYSDFIKRSNQLVLRASVSLFLMPLLIGLMALVDKFKLFNAEFLFPVFIGTPIYFVYCNISYHFLKCPQCRKPYYGGVGNYPLRWKHLTDFKHLLGRKCRYCGLEFKKPKKFRLNSKTN